MPKKNPTCTFDVHSFAWDTTPEYNILFLRAQKNWANEKLISRGHVFLNEIYDALSVDRTPDGAITGWLYNEQSDKRISFGDLIVGQDGAIFLEFNVDGIIYDKI